MQDANVPALALQFPNQRDNAAKPASVAILDSANAIGIVEMDKGYPAFLMARRCCRARDEKQRYKEH